MSKKQKKRAPVGVTHTERKKPHFLTVFVAVFLTLVVALSLTLGIVSATKNSAAVVKYNGQTMDQEVASFFLGYYKYRFMSALSQNGVVGVEDSPGFWNKVGDDGKTYGEMLREGATEYLKQVLVANYLYDNYTKLTSSDRNKISKACEELVTYRADGKKSEFNKLVKEYGFDYSSLYEAAMMLYKATMAERVIYGVNGSNIANFPSMAEEYFETYSHVHLVFIRTESKFVYENGNRVKGDDGQYLTEPLTPEEKADRDAIITDMRDAIAAIGGTGGVSMSEEMFFNYQASYDEGDEGMYADGYYFNKQSSYTAEFASVMGEVVDKALELEVGEYGELTLDFAVCFIYKSELTPGAYGSSLAEDCFEDFFSDASTYLFNQSIEELSSKAKITKKYASLDVILMPYNHAYLPRF